MAVRTPMQWTSGRNGGFSTVRPSRLVSPVVPGGYGPDHVNVADQRRDPDSLWHFMHRLIRAYRACPEFGWGAFEVLDQPNRSVLAHRCATDEAAVVAVHNLGSEPVTLQLDVAPAGTDLVDLLDNLDVTTDAKGMVEISLEAYGHRWLRVHAGDRPRLP